MEPESNNVVIDIISKALHGIGLDAFQVLDWKAFDNLNTTNDNLCDGLAFAAENINRLTDEITQEQARRRADQEEIMNLARQGYVRKRITGAREALVPYSDPNHTYCCQARWKTVPELAQAAKGVLSKPTVCFLLADACGELSIILKEDQLDSLPYQQWDSYTHQRLHMAVFFQDMSLQLHSLIANYTMPHTMRFVTVWSLGIPNFDPADYAGVPPEPPTAEDVEFLTSPPTRQLTAPQVKIRLAAYLKAISWMIKVILRFDNYYPLPRSLQWQDLKQQYSEVSERYLRRSGELSSEESLGETGPAVKRDDYELVAEGCAVMCGLYEMLWRRHDREGNGHEQAEEVSGVKKEEGDVVEKAEDADAAKGQIKKEEGAETEVGEEADVKPPKVGVKKEITVKYEPGVKKEEAEDGTVLKTEEL